MKTILLKFSGPLQAWGTDSHFEIRHSDSHPSKSAVIGMIAAGLGYRREEEAGLRRLNTLDFAVRVDQPGQMLRDYHTAHKYKENGDFDRTYVTNRYYLQDAVFLAALGSEDEELIRDVKEAVTIPFYPAFLGRRALAPTSDLYLGIKGSDVIHALMEYPWQAASWYQKNHSPRVELYADAGLMPGGSVRIRHDEAVSFSQIVGRKFAPRREARIVLNLAADSGHPDIRGLHIPEHDAFGAIGEN